MSMLSGKNIVLGVGGGISAYRTLELIRLLKKSSANVRVMPTANALEFIGKISFESLSGAACITDSLSVVDGKISHIEEAYKADVIVVAPATCDLISKMAHGMADSLILQTILSFRGPVLVVPAMESNMWDHAATQKNISTLKEFGYVVVGPEIGDLASGRSGVGRMSGPERIFEQVESIISKKDFFGKKVLVTAGPTVEDIDPVRFLSNRSSGKMGVSLAKSLAQRGAEVHLVYGPISVDIPTLRNLQKYPVRSAAEMHQKVHDLINGCEIAIMCAAVADFSVKNVALEKIKKGETPPVLDLQKNPDILASLGALGGRPFLVGFAAETENLEKEALRKLKEKNCDLICANLVSDLNGVFDQETNHVFVFDRDNTKTELTRATKDRIASQILDVILLKLCDR